MPHILVSQVNKFQIEKDDIDEESHQSLYFFGHCNFW
jgi:hypothetical protein